MEPRQRLRKRVLVAITAAAGLSLYLFGIAATSRLHHAAADFEPVEINGELRGLWVWPKEPVEPLPAVLCANGVTGTREFTLPIALDLARHGVATLLFDFAGQGRSRGPFSPSKDLDPVLEHVKGHARIDPARIGAFGHSMGGKIVAARSGEFASVVVFGAKPASDDPRILVGHSRFEFLFDRPDGPNVVVGPWSDHVTGPMDTGLLEAAVGWFGKGLGFERTHPSLEGARIGSRAASLLGGAVVVLAALMLLPQSIPTIVKNSHIPPFFLWMTAIPTFVFPILLIRGEAPMLRTFRVGRWKPLAAGLGAFLLVYGLAVGFASWSFFNVTLHSWKLGFFFIASAINVVILWHDQNLVHGAVIEKGEGRWRELWRAAVSGATGRWIALACLFLLVAAVTGRAGIWMILAGLAFLVFWLEALAAALSVRIRHPLAGATFLGLAWAWLATVFLPG